tara:strand:- start:2287 stop:2748 length:462 start_codon:yes stop_codon:yes gene_type:complete
MMHSSIYNEKYMRLAIQQALLAFQDDEVPVGAVIVKDNQIISYGHNQCEYMQSPSRHAEIIAIESACKSLGNYRLIGCSMYVTLEPCHMCAMAIIHSRIKNVFYGAKEPKFGAIESVDTFFEKDFLNHRVSYDGGYLEQECSELLKKFFSSKR